MAPKKGGGGAGLYDTVMSVMMLPITLAMQAVYYPTDYLMWIIVDKFGDEKWMKKKGWKQKLMVNPWFNELVKFTKEFRYVLYDFGWKRVPSPVWRCRFCSRAATGDGSKGYWKGIWCVECNKKHCDQCAYNQHAPGTLASLHSLEEIDTEEQSQTGVHLVTPVLAELIVVAFLILAHQNYMSGLITEDYLTTQITCPMSTKARSIVASIDANIYYHFKETFFKWCDMEDSFMRFILDSWVRSLVTNTDNTLLVLQTLPQALLFDVVLMYTVVPVISFAYAFINNLFYQLEVMIPRTHNLVQLETYISYFALFDYFDSGDFSNVPPETKWRSRPALDPYEAWTYWKNRKMRMLSYYYKTNLDTLRNMIWNLLTFIMVFRLACIWLGLAAPVRAIFSFIDIFGTMAKHKEWFANTTNMFFTESNFHGLASSLSSMTAGIMQLQPKTMVYMYILWLVVSLAITAAFAYVCYYLVMVRRDMMKVWLSKENVTGSCLDAVDFGAAKLLAPRPSPKKFL